jgi:hypothetical protein
MMRWLITGLLSLTLALPVSAQTKRATRRPPPKPAPPQTEPAPLECPSVLGSGISTHRVYCDVLTGRDPKDGIILKLPPHTGPVTLMFDLHNRHTYSEELVKSNRAYRKYTATVGVLTEDNTLLSRAIIQSEFRVAANLVERIGGGAGPGGVKAVAPTGTERIEIEIPAEEEMVSILGEKLSVVRVDGPDNFTAPGRPIAVISNAEITYRPAPVKAAAPLKAPPKKKR